MLLDCLFSKPVLTVKLERDTIFVRPPPLAGATTDDPELRGTVRVHLRAPRELGSISVVIEGACDAYGGEGWHYESSTPLRKVLVLDLANERFDAGTHTFTFSFIIPSSSAPYQRSTYGRLRHSVLAILECSSGIRSSYSSDSMAFSVLAIQHAPNEPPEPLEVVVDHLSEILGLVWMGASSAHLTVASLLSLRLVLVDVPAHIIIRSIDCAIVQRVTVHYEDGRVACPPPWRCELRREEPERLALNANDSLPLVDLVAGGAWAYSCLLRVPSEDIVRPSTLEGTEACIRVSHKLSVDIRHREDDSVEDRITTLTSPVVVTTCCSDISSLFPPAYERDETKPSRREAKKDCMCDYSMEEIVDRDGVALHRAVSMARAEDTVRPARIDKSPISQPLFQWSATPSLKYQE